MSLSARRIFIFAIILLLAGCATMQQDSSRNSAVISLMEQAHRYSSNGELEQAGASLERALRIEPRNPHLWQELARVRLDQGQSRQAENLAKKSNALGPDNRRLQHENWLIISEARTFRGDIQGASAARSRAEEN